MGNCGPFNLQSLGMKLNWIANTNEETSSHVACSSAVFCSTLSHSSIPQFISWNFSAIPEFVHWKQPRPQTRHFEKWRRPWRRGWGLGLSQMSLRVALAFWFAFQGSCQGRVLFCSFAEIRNFLPLGNYGSIFDSKVSWEWYSVSVTY